jgi:Protein of unknown function (DUF2971)
MLYKYLKIQSLFDIVIKQRLYFHPLWQQEDAREGDATNMDTEALGDFYERNPQAKFIDINEFIKLGKVTSSASCWHQSSSESIAMWNIYAGKNYGMCIVVDREKLLRSAHEFKNIRPIDVEYIDRKAVMTVKAELPPLYHFAQFKDLAYASEREFRLLHLGQIVTDEIALGEGRKMTKFSVEKSKIKLGHFMPFDANSLIDKVIISPYTKSFECDILVEVLKKIGLTAPVEMSSIELNI